MLLRYTNITTSGIKADFLGKCATIFGLHDGTVEEVENEEQMGTGEPANTKW